MLTFSSACQRFYSSIPSNYRSYKNPYTFLAQAKEKQESCILLSITIASSDNVDFTKKIYSYVRIHLYLWSKFVLFNNFKITRKNLKTTISLTFYYGNYGFRTKRDCNQCKSCTLCRLLKLRLILRDWSRDFPVFSGFSSGCESNKGQELLPSKFWQYW